MYITTTYNERYDNLCKTFGKVDEIVCETTKMTQLLVDDLRSFANKHGLQNPLSPNNQQQHPHITT